MPRDHALRLLPLPRQRRARVLALIVRRLVDAGGLSLGTQTQLAELFGVSRQRVHQVVLAMEPDANP